MYKILKIEDKIKVSPSKFELGLENAVKASLEEKWEGLVNKNLGVILAVISIGDVGEGKILPGDGSIHYPVNFELLVYQPDVHELVKGYIIDVTEFGVFVRIGPIDAMVHVSQLMDDFVSYDPKNMLFTGKESKRILKENDIVRARIISVSIEKQYKVGLTTRQPGLGALSWFEKKKREKKKEDKKSDKKEIKKAGKKKK